MELYFLDIVGSGRLFKDRQGESHRSRVAALASATLLGQEIAREFGEQYGYTVELRDEARRLIARFP